MTASLLIVSTLLATTVLPEPAAVDTVHYRVYRADGTPSSIEEIESALTGADVLFVGEAHNDPVVHQLQLELLQRAYKVNGQKPGSVALSMEMFARDAQYIVDEYLNDLVTEDQFLKASVPWDNYETDYSPLVEFAKSHKLHVIAANAPRRYANRLTRLGRESLLELSDKARSYLPPLPYAEASEKYAEQFAQAMVEAMEEMAEMALKAKEKAAMEEEEECMCKCPMKEEDIEHGETEEGMQHGKTEEGKKKIEEAAEAAHAMPAEPAEAAEMPHAMPAEPAEAEAPTHGMAGGMPSTSNMLDTQSLWDATMAYAIAEYQESHPGVQVLHIVGGFHVHTGTGIPEHLARYAPSTTTLIVSVEPVEDINTFNPDEHENLGDFVILSDESLPRTFETSL